MRPSKLDRYLNILEALVDRPRRLDDIAYDTHMECGSLKRHLDFLISNGVVEKRELHGKRVFYAINERGFSVFKKLRAMKYFEKLRKTLHVVEEAREIASVLGRHTQGLKKP